MYLTDVVGVSFGYGDIDRECKNTSILFDIGWEEEER